MKERPKRRKRALSYDVSASSIVDLLAARHTRDLFFPEVKDGPSIFGGHLRLDALAIAKSWSPVRLMAYEVKTSRSDWLGDRKWEAYLDLAHHLTIVSPSGVLHPEEVPAEVGILEVSSTGASLRWIRKAAYRAIRVPSDLLLYLLMSRVVPGNPHAIKPLSRDERIAEWRDRLNEGRSIDYAIKEKIRERIQAAERAGRLGPELQDLEVWLASKGQRWGSLRERCEGAMSEAVREIERAQDALARAAAEVADLLSSAAEKHTPSAAGGESKGEAK